MSDVYNDDLAIQDDFCSSLGSGHPFLRSFEMLQNSSLEPFLNSSLLQVYYVFFVYLLVIVILNGVIIALVTNTYDTVDQNAQNVFWRGRLELVIEIEIWEEFFEKGLKLMGKDRVSRTHEYSDLFYEGLLLSFEDATHNLTKQQNWYDLTKQQNWYMSGIGGEPWWFGAFEVVGLDYHILHWHSDLKPLYRTRLFAVVIIPLWTLIGFLSLGLLLPIHTRSFLLDGKVSGKIEDNLERMKGSLEKLQNHGKVMEDKLETVELNLEKKLQNHGDKLESVELNLEKKMKDKLETVELKLGKLENKMDAILQLLTTLKQ